MSHTSRVDTSRQTTHIGVVVTKMVGRGLMRSRRLANGRHVVMLPLVDEAEMAAFGSVTSEVATFYAAPEQAEPG